ncbi:MAG: hypothetical protein IKK75_09580 [Clostridia bacterium]|nr:hypothetical protein [Clostridia bacterium]
MTETQAAPRNAGRLFVLFKEHSDALYFGFIHDTINIDLGGDKNAK